MQLFFSLKVKQLYLFGLAKSRDSLRKQIGAAFKIAHLSIFHDEGFHQVGVPENFLMGISCLDWTLSQNWLTYKKYTKTKTWFNNLLYAYVH